MEPFLIDDIAGRFEDRGTFKKHIYMPFHPVKEMEYH